MSKQRPTREDAGTSTNDVGGTVGLNGVYSESGEMALSGTDAGFSTLAGLIRSGRSGRLVMSVRSDPSPYDGVLTEVRVSPAESAERHVIIERHGTTLHIAGSPSGLSILAANVDAAARLAAGEHVHISHHPNHFYLRPESEDLVLEKVLVDSSG